MIVVTGTIDIDPDQRDAFVAATRALMAATRAEEGCEHYSFAADLDDPGRFYIAEQWASEEAMGAHMQQPHMAEFLTTVGGLVRATSLTRWDGATPSKLM